MSKKQIALVAVVVVVASALSAVVAYRRGLKSVAGAAAAGPGCVDIHEAANHVGENGCVAARVFRVFTSSGGNTFLDFCANYRDCPFTSVIFASDRAKFGRLDNLAGHEVELRGDIVPYRGHPEIVLRDSNQIRVRE